MPSYSKYDIILVKYPSSDLSSSKVRHAAIVSAPHSSQDTIVVPLTSKVGSLLGGELELSEWAAAGLNVATAVKRGVYTVHENLAIKPIGSLLDVDAERLDLSLTIWLGL